LNHQYANNAGKHGALTKNQHDRVSSYALYGEDVLSLTARLSAVLGVRAERATRETGIPSCPTAINPISAPTSRSAPGLACCTHSRLAGPSSSPMRVEVTSRRSCSS
jgi:outer membrane receptor protein involved in Fe transport